ncbi:MAG: ATP-binding protein, partial [Hyphomicrobiales bacterium]|nr:ATP-binding protein [Hyphomicrobiales bacterium]
MTAENAADASGSHLQAIDGLENRREENQPTERMIGRVIACDAGFATLSTMAGNLTSSLADFWSIGKLISINIGESRIVGLVYKIDAPRGAWDRDQQNLMNVYVELVGEVRDTSGGGAVFSRGISTYPYLGAHAHRIRSNDLRAIYRPDGHKSVEIGQLSQDIEIPAIVSIDDMVRRHFAVVGTTGTGKSTAVSLLVHEVITARPALSVLMLDPHNEFDKAFKGISNIVSCDTLQLPFWLFQLEEFVEVVFRGRTGIEGETDALRDLIPLAKARHNQAMSHGASLLRRATHTSNITADTPVPYRMSELLHLIDERIGQLEARHDRSVLRSLKNRLETLISDPRYQFMFPNRTIDDTMAEIISTLFRIPANGKPVTVFQLAGIPSEVVNAVVSVMCRIAFDVAMWSNGANEVLVVCEEAHRYVPLDPSLGFAPTRQSIARIAKEGRKYGCYLGVVTQRPSELDPTILSQCSTVFAMRL